MKIDHKFFENEVRNGFFVPTIMKECWAASMSKMEVLDSICRKYAIRYFAGYGTLLGAVRHGGFIPWDDDMDIFMLRNDYEKLLKVIDKELPPEYMFVSRRKDEDFGDGLAAIVDSLECWGGAERIIRDHGFPYITSLDIFPLDYISEDSEKQEEMRELVLLLNGLECFYDEYSDEEKQTILDGLTNGYNVRFDLSKPIKPQLLFLVDAVSSMCSEEEADNLAFIPFWVKERKNEFFDKHAFDETIWIPFENIMVPAPKGYDAVLRGLYGDYTKIVRGMAGHGYPYFDKYRGHLKEPTKKLIYYAENNPEIPKAVGKVDKDNKKIVFIASRFSEWKSLKSLYLKACSDDKCETVLIVAPYYETTGVEKYGIKELPEISSDIELFDKKYDPVDGRRHVPDEFKPDIIVTCDPYDYWNDAYMLYPQYMCESLRKMCERLVYIQPFVIDDYEEGDIAAFKMAEYYVCTPGVFLSDFVFVQSEKMREAYVRRIKDSAGEEKAKTLKDRIYGIGLPEWDDESSNHFASLVWDIINH